MSAKYRSSPDELTDNELHTLFEGELLLERWEAEIQRRYDTALPADSADSPEKPLHPKLVERLKVCRWARVFDILSKAAAACDDLPGSASLRDDLAAISDEIVKLYVLEDAKRDRIARIRKSPTISSADILNERSKSESWRECAERLGISERHLRRLRKLYELD